MIESNADKTLVTSLHKGIRVCRQITKPMLNHRARILEEYANGFFEDKPHVKKPLNKVYRALSILVPWLASQNPKAMIRPRLIQLKPFADTYRLTLNYLSDKIDFGITLKELVLDGLTYIGITKTGLAQGGPEIEDVLGYLHDAGQIYTDRVDPEDYLFDCVA